MAYQGLTYEMRPSVQVGQPEIDLEAHGFWHEWDELDQIPAAGSDTMKCCKLAFTVNHPRATEWDWYYIDEIGVLSVRACSVVWPFLRDYCWRFQTTVNGRPYFIMRPNGTVVDCVLRSESVLEPAPDDPDWFLSAKRLRFDTRLLRDPQLFIVPEMPNMLLVTESIKRKVEEADLNGFEFVNCEHLYGYYA